MSGEQSGECDEVDQRDDGEPPPGRPSSRMASDEELWFEADDLALRSSVSLAVRQAELCWLAPLASLASNQLDDRQHSHWLALQALATGLWQACGQPLPGEMVWIDCAGDALLRMDLAGALAETMAWPANPPPTGQAAAMVVHACAGPWGWIRRRDRAALRWGCELTNSPFEMKAHARAEHPWSARLRWALADSPEAAWVAALRGQDPSKDASAWVIYERPTTTSSASSPHLAAWRLLAQQASWVFWICADGPAPTQGLARHLVAELHLREAGQHDGGLLFDLVGSGPTQRLRSPSPGRLCWWPQRATFAWVAGKSASANRGDKRKGR